MLIADSRMPTTRWTANVCLYELAPIVRITGVGRDGELASNATSPRHEDFFINDAAVKRYARGRGDGSRAGIGYSLLARHCFFFFFWLVENSG